MHGTLDLGADGAFAYVPDTGYVGDDAFVYRAFDGTQWSEATQVLIVVRPVNDVPTAVEDAYDLDEDATLVVGAATGVLANDIDGDPLVAMLVSGPQFGQLTLLDDGSFTYRPDDDFNGTDEFVYRAGDGASVSSDVVVTLRVAPSNDVPVAVDDAYGVIAGTPKLGNVLDNDRDADVDLLAVELVDAPEHGTLTLNASGSFVYLANDGYLGTDRFTYRVSDGSGLSPLATVELDVVERGTGPVALTDGVETDEDTAILIDVLANDEAALVDDVLSILSVDTAGTLGQVSIRGDGRIEYDPSGRFDDLLVGQTYADRFVYVTTNQRGETAAAEVWVLVTGMNEAPEFVSAPVVSVQADARTVAGAQDRSFLVGATGEVTLELVSGDKTKIEAGLYRVDDATGRIGTLRPGDAGYLEAALSAERALVGFNSRALAGATQSLALIEGELYGAYLIVSPRRIATPGAAPVGPAPFGANVYFSFEGANAEAYDHLRAQVVNGALELRWENGLHTLDRDYDDLVLRVTGFELGGEAHYVYDAQAVDIDGGTLTYSLLDAPQGATIDAATGRITLSTGAGKYDFVVAVDDGQGGEAQQAFTLTVTEDAATSTPVKVEALSATPSGFRVRFDRAIETGSVGTADILLRNAQGEALAGALVFDADRAGLTFIAAGPALAAGTYTVQLKSGVLSVQFLDGNGDGAPDDDYIATISIAANATLGRVSIGDVDGEPGASIARLPVQLISDGKVNAVRFNLVYDPALLTIEAATLATGLPTGVFLSTNFSTPGYARFVLSASKALPAGVLNLIDVRVSVPASAPLGATQVLDVVEVFVNGSVIAADDDGLQRAGEVPVQIPIGAQIDTPSAHGENAAPPTLTVEPSKLSKLLTRLKETLTGSAAKSIAVSLEASQAPPLPRSEVVSTNSDAVRTLGSADGTIVLDLDALQVGAPAKSLVTGSSEKWQSDFVSRLGSSEYINPNATLKVVLPTVQLDD